MSEGLFLSYTLAGVASSHTLDNELELCFSPIYLIILCFDQWSKQSIISLFNSKIEFNSKYNFGQNRVLFLN